MPARTVTVGSSVGLHARPAAAVAAAAANAPMRVMIGKPGGKPVNAASPLGLMSLGAKFGQEVVISAEGEGADAVVDQVADLVAAPDAKPAASA